MIERRWARTKPGSDAEVDFLVQVGAEVVPVEVKAGATGSMKSLHRYLIEKQRDFGVRINGDSPSYVRTTYADEVRLSSPTLASTNASKRPVSASGRTTILVVRKRGKIETGWKPVLPFQEKGKRF